MKKKTSLVLTLVVLSMVFLCACGEKGSKIKDYSGYYIYNKEYKSVDYNRNCYEAMEISSKGEVVYWAEYDYSFLYNDSIGKTCGSIDVDKEASEAIFYNTSYEGGNNTDWREDFPLIFKLINDGEGLYVDGSNNWEPDSYTRVSKKEYKEFCEEHHLNDETLEAIGKEFGSSSYFEGLE